MRRAEFKEKYTTKDLQFTEDLLRDLAMMKSEEVFNFHTTDLGQALSNILEVIPKSINEI